MLRLRMGIPTNPEILALLARLDSEVADDLETQFLDFKPWQGAKEDMKVAVEYAVCFANAEGGVVVFGVADTFLRDNAFIDTLSAAKLLQLSREEARTMLDRLAQPETGFLERKGRTKATTFHLTKGAARDLHGKAAYTRTRGLDPIRYAEMVRAFVADHGSITPRECRELLGLGESQSARVEVSKYLRIWSSPNGFLRREGTRGPTVRYFSP